MAHLLAGQADRARFYVEEVLDMEPESGEALEALGLVLEALCEKGNGENGPECP
jgi:hypothetical protein